MKTIRLLLSLLLLVTMACKKNKDIAPEKKEEEAKTAMDISQYFIVSDYTFIIGDKSVVHPLLLTFDNKGKATFYDFAAVGNNQRDYVFVDNVLTVNIGSGLSWVFKISGNSIVSADGMPPYHKNFKLYKVPETNQFNGNSYSGVLLAREINSGMPFRYIFNETQFGETVIDPPGFTYAYTVINNVAAITTINRIIRYFLILNGRLMISRYDLNTNTPAKFYYGSLSKD